MVAIMLIAIWMIPGIVQEIPGLGCGQVLGDEELRPDPLEVPECLGGVSGHGRLGLRGRDREKMGNRTARDVSVEHRRLEGPLGGEDRGDGVSEK